MLIARAGDGSMRDAQSAFDQVIAFAGRRSRQRTSRRSSASSAGTCCSISPTRSRGKMAPAAFELAGQAVESGYDLRRSCESSARLTRDLLVVRIDASRVTDPEMAAEGERDRSRRWRRSSPPKI